MFWKEIRLKKFQLVNYLNKLKTFFFTKYESKGASSRYRTLQYLEYLPKEIEYEVLHLFDNEYIELLYNSKKKPLLKVLVAFISRLFKLILLFNTEALFVIENELFPYLPFCFEKVFLSHKKKFVLIYDDAIFHNYDLSNNFYLKLNQNKIGKLMRLAKNIIVGNKYLKEYAEKWIDEISKISIIPTVVDERNYRTNKMYTSLNKRKLNLVWIGSPATVDYLNELKPLFQDNWFIENIKLIIIGAENLFANYQIEIEIEIESLKWSEERELEMIQLGDIGIMPLPNIPWTKGKCGFKLIQYMMAGLPCIASPVSINSEIILHGKTGYLANNSNEWLLYLKDFRENEKLIKEMGQYAREIALNKYTTQATKDAWLEIMV